MIESTLPCTDIPCHDQWEHLLLNHGYVFACMAGVNRYYLDRRRIHLLENITSMQSFLSRFEVVVMRMQEPKISFKPL